LFEKRLSRKTLKAYAIDLEQFRRHMLNQGLSSILLVSKIELKKYLHFISAFKPKTTKRKVASLKAFFNFPEYEELIDVNPLRKIRISIKEP